MKITYLGHSALVVEEGSFKGIIDPFISGNPSSIASVEGLKNITHVFVTHGHGDHLGDAVEIARNNNSLIIANAEICAYLNRFKVRTHSMHIGGRYRFDFGTVKMTTALHGSGITDGGNIICGGNPCGFVIEVAGRKIYHAGDTGLTLDMNLLEDENIDAAFLPIGGNYTMDIDDAVKAARFVKAKVTVPIHYNTFGVIAADPADFLNKAKGLDVVILGINESMNL
ncbi:MAG: metal-dependent hydrolase [Sedimentibacter sp.]|uniref:metal-dependent hydrolase n=1 Tax=Sedimentibacter sp. TaxID=1960295 RepID=UPI003158801C